jgi:hypothetical protein
MPAETVRGETGRHTSEHPELALVWIDSRTSTIVRSVDDAPQVERVRSDVPPHRRATGYQGHHPAGGAGADGEPRRLEHLARFIHEVSRRVPPDADVLVIGPGTVRWRLLASLRDHDAHHGIRRELRCGPAPRSTDAQLIARFRREAGTDLRRRSLSARHRGAPGIVRSTRRRSCSAAQSGRPRASTVGRPGRPSPL